MNKEMRRYRIGQLQRDISAVWEKYRRLQLELADLLQADQAEMSESTTTGQLLTETDSGHSGHVRYRNQE